MTAAMLAAGFAAGILASMGMGGGTVLLLYLRLFTDTDQLTSGKMNLLFFMPSAVVSIIIYAKKKLIKWKEIFPIIIIGAAGAVIGSVITNFIDPSLIGKLFAFLLIFIGAKEIFRVLKKR